MADVKVARYRNSEYIVRCEIDGNQKVYTWKGSRNGKHDIKKVPQEVVDWLNMNSQCLSQGALVIVDNTEESKQLKDEIADRDSYDKNTHSHEEIVKILKGNYKKMEKELSEITVDDEKRFVIDVANELKDELTGGKQNFISEWAGIEKDILFD